MKIPYRNEKETEESWEKREKAFHKKIDALITVIEPVHETIMRLHYNLPPKPSIDDMTDIEIYADNRRWKYVHGQVDKNGDDIITEDDINNPYSGMDWVDPEDKEDDWLPDGPDIDLDQNALSKMIESGNMMVNEDTRRKLMAEAADDEIMELLRSSSVEY